MTNDVSSYKINSIKAYKYNLICRFKKKVIKMNIQELFRQADPERIFYGYILIEPVFSKFEPIPYEKQTQALIKLKEYIVDACDRFKTCNISTDDNPGTVFVMKRRSLNYGESYLGNLENRMIYDNAAFDAIDKDFRIWDDEGDAKLSFYGIDCTPISKLSGYTVAAESVNHMGINICCATILKELFFWGFTEEKREKSIKEFEESLAAGEKDIEEGRHRSFEELVEELELEWSSDESEDEKEYRRLKKEFEKSVKEIEHRYMEMIINEDHQAFIDAVKYEYQNRN